MEAENKNFKWIQI